MKEITADMIKELRERTGVGMGKCKEALVLSEGDMEKAIDHLRKIGMAAGVKKEGREAKEGLIFAGEDKVHLVLAEARPNLRNRLEPSFILIAHGAKQTLAILLGAGCATDESPQTPVPTAEDPPADPVPEVVSSIEDVSKPTYPTSQ